jgi:uncharacterized protein
MLRVVLDTNIIVSAVAARTGPPAQVFTLFLSGAIRNCCTKNILMEVEQVFSRRKIAERVPSELLVLVRDALHQKSVMVSPSMHVNAVPEDPADNMFLECALAGSADYVITGDWHLLRLKRYRTVDIISPATFLKVYSQLE